LSEELPNGTLVIIPFVPWRVHRIFWIVRIAAIGFTVLAGSPAEFGKFIAEETEKWGKVIRAANIKPD